MSCSCFRLVHVETRETTLTLQEDTREKSERSVLDLNCRRRSVKNLLVGVKDHGHGQKSALYNTITGFLHLHELEAVTLYDAKRAEANTFGGTIISDNLSYNSEAHNLASVGRGSWFKEVCSKITGLLHPHELEAVTLYDANWFESIELWGYHGCCSGITGFLHSHEVDAVTLHDVKRVERNNSGGTISDGVFSDGIVTYFACNQMAYELANIALTNSSWDYGEGSVSPTVASAVRLHAELVAFN